jgi:DNA-binding MurR/RpiR family transcriptional regulator
MKTDFHRQATWNADADRQFSSSPLGRKIATFLRDGSSSQRQLSEFVLRDPVFVATRGIEDLAAATTISASTISRYVRDLGLANYAEFRSTVGETVTELIAPVTKLNATMRDERQRNSAVEMSIAAAEFHIAALRDPQTAELVRSTAKTLSSATRIYAIGFGFSAHLAAMLTLALQPYRENVINVAQYGGTESAAARLMSVTEGDLLVAISFPRYSRDVVDMVRYARDNGARIVALTDSSASPIAQYADDLLLAPAQHPVISSSSVPAMVLIEALVSEFLLADPDNVKRAEKLATAIASYLATDHRPSS